MEARLIKIDRNGSKHYEGYVTCDHCGGIGLYAIGIHNGELVLSPHDYGVCWKCGGTGKVLKRWIERTPEYQAKLDGRRKAKLEKEAKEQERFMKEAEAKRMAEEAKIREQKAVSQHLGNVGDKLTAKAVYINMASYEVRSFRGYGTDTIHIHIFKDSDGNVLIWKTTAFVDAEYGDEVEITGRVKEHSVYREEKQTVLTRCRIKA